MKIGLEKYNMRVTPGLIWPRIDNGHSGSIKDGEILASCEYYCLKKGSFHQLTYILLISAIVARKF
jgi:hypothetical protein